MRLPWTKSAANPKVLDGLVHRDSRLAVAPDGKTLAVTLFRSNLLAVANLYSYELFVIHLDAGRIVRLSGFNDGVQNKHPAKDGGDALESGGIRAAELREPVVVRAKDGGHQRRVRHLEVKCPCEG